jgi:hypothetical protein
MYGEYQKRMKKKRKKKETQANDNALLNQEARGDAPKPRFSPSIYSSSSSHHSHHSNASHKSSFKKPLLKLDVKFDLPMFNGDANLEKLDNWIRQVEVYFPLQQIYEEEVKVQLASLQLEDTALIWWEIKLYDIIKCGNHLSSWSEFKSTIRKQFYPLVYLPKAMMEWKTLRQSKG